LVFGRKRIHFEEHVNHHTTALSRPREPYTMQVFKKKEKKAMPTSSRNENLQSKRF
jgi:hypothetical protein